MLKKSSKENSTWVDPDDAPELTDAFFDNAVYRIGDEIVSREEGLAAMRARATGRPKGSGTKDAVYVRLDKDLLEALRATGRGWQTRLNAHLRKAMGM